MMSFREKHGHSTVAIIAKSGEAKASPVLPGVSVGMPETTATRHERDAIERRSIRQWLDYDARHTTAARGAGYRNCPSGGDEADLAIG